MRISPIGLRTQPAPRFTGSLVIRQADLEGKIALQTSLGTPTESSNGYDLWLIHPNKFEAKTGAVEQARVPHHAHNIDINPHGFQSLSELYANVDAMDGDPVAHSEAARGIKEYMLQNQAQIASLETSIQAYAGMSNFG